MWVDGSPTIRGPMLLVAGVRRRERFRALPHLSSVIQMYYTRCVAEVEWDPEAVSHMWERHSVTPSEAEEALSDPDAIYLMPDPASRSGRSDRCIGWSKSREQIVVVIIVRHEGRVYGANAWPANDAHVGIYEGGRADEHRHSR